MNDFKPDPELIRSEGRGYILEAPVDQDNGTSEAQEAPPRRYELRDADTGEKLSGTSFVLTPTGEELHRYVDEGMQISGPAGTWDVNVYYTQPENTRPRVASVIVGELIPEEVAYKMLQYLSAKRLHRLAHSALRQAEKKNGSDANPTA